MDVGIANSHRWNITRVSYVNGLAYTGPGQEISNVSVALIYLLQNGTQPVELVWWEIQDIHAYHSDTSDPQLPIGLERKILGLEQVDDEQETEGGDGEGGEQVDRLPWASLAFIAVAVAVACVLVARKMKNGLCEGEGGDYELLDKESCDNGERNRAWL
ncbi:hypothetical protein GTA08_BOTSDO03921 [Neofusicoccum parvum]|uniref:Uncharacterized protein n=1 Tax=Neofusicoccum parvum TaxID=310453 RepID=A0ACB5SIV1_9PEZI|nr:hypothetical protein GTA08_BOTSDO03921 [Neofusicoccum parvum]